jgi:hypothetical protein
MFVKSERSASARRVLLEPEATPPGERAALEGAFFKSICLPNGTHKTTSPRGLVDVDDLLCELLASNAALHVLDVGISSGVTTLEMLDRLAARGHEVTGVGVDVRIHAYLRRWMGIDLLYDPQGNALQLSTPIFTRGRPDHPLSTAKSQSLYAALTGAERLLVRRWIADPASSRPAMLLSPRLSERPGFSVVEHDLRRAKPEWTGSFDVVRAANVLNLSIFRASGPRVDDRAVGRLAESRGAAGHLLHGRGGWQQSRDDLPQRRGHSLAAPGPADRAWLRA